MEGVALLIPICIPIAAFIFVYYSDKNKKRTVLEISRHVENAANVDEWMAVCGAKKQEPLDDRRNGVVAMFTGLGLFLFGVFFLGSILKGAGALVGAIGIGMLIAGYLYPNTSGEINQAVDAFEKK